MILLSYTKIYLKKTFDWIIFNVKFNFFLIWVLKRKFTKQFIYILKVLINKSH